MTGITNTTFYAYSIFVIGTIIHLPNKSFIKKGRVVMNIQGLNKIFEFDAYSMPLQTDIISCVQDCQYIFVMNCVTFFHQGSVAEKNRHKLIVINHREFEQGNVAVMKYRNTTTYVQKKGTIYGRNIAISVEFISMMGGYSIIRGTNIYITYDSYSHYSSKGI